MINIESFANPLALMTNPTLSKDFFGIVYWIWIVKESVFFQKIFSLFSMLFGAGAYLLITRAEAAGKGAVIADIYYRRLFWLILFGLIHAYLIWPGDVLFYYGVVGLFLYPIRKLSLLGMVTLAAVLLATAMLFAYVDYRDKVSLKTEAALFESDRDSGKELTAEQNGVLERWKKWQGYFHPEKEALEKEIATMSRGSYLQIIESQAEWVRNGHTNWLYGRVFFQILMMMVIGMILVKASILSAQSPRKIYYLMVIAGYLIGFFLAFIRLRAYRADGFGVISGRATMVGFLIEMIAVALGHIGLICLFCKLNILGWFRASLAAVGRMAFSNYILQSLICTVLFYGYGFGLYGSLNKVQQLWIVGFVWVLEMIVSPIWLKRFRFGPLEWMWRSFTYWRRQPMLVG